MPYRILANFVLVTHLGVVVFVVGGLACILVGNFCRIWPWVNSLGYRLAHLAAIGGVVLQSWLGQKCPLTTLESWLRVQSGASGYEQKGFLSTGSSNSSFTRPRVGFLRRFTQVLRCW